MGSRAEEKSGGGYGILDTKDDEGRRRRSGGKRGKAKQNEEGKRGQLLPEFMSFRTLGRAIQNKILGNL